MKFLLPVLLLLGACAPREVLYPLVGRPVPRLNDFARDFTPPVSNETGLPVGGFGGAKGGEPGGVNRTPVIFVHGNTVSANYWLGARAYFKQKGYRDDELWAPSYGWNNVRAFDSADLSVATLEAFVTEVQKYLSQKTGRPIRQVDIIGHSLGVTLVRQWMMQRNAWHRVRTFVAAAGANQGVWTARPDARGQNRAVAFEIYPGSPWLTQLNRIGETPGATRYLTLYDGTGWGDVLFPKPYEHSGALKGAKNVAYNVEHGTHYDHLELPRMPQTMDVMLEFFGKEPIPQAEPPQLLREANVVFADQADAKVHCETGGKYPQAPSTGAARFELTDGTLATCFAHSARSGLSSPMAHYKRKDAHAPLPLTLTAQPSGGVFEQPQFVKLTASDPDAFIVYSTGGGADLGAPGGNRDNGLPLYTEPVYISAPVKMSAVAIAPDGRRSEPLMLDFDISIELIDTQRSLQRQFDAQAPAPYAGKRKKGN